MSHIERRRGDTYDIDLAVILDSGQSISGATFLMTADPDQTPSSGSANIFQITGTITDAANGEVTFTPSAADVDNVGTYYYDVQMTLSGTVYTVAYGTIEFIQDITK